MKYSSFVSRCDQLEWFTKAAWNAAVTACKGGSPNYHSAASLFTASADLQSLFPVQDASCLDSEKVTRLAKQTITYETMKNRQHRHQACTLPEVSFIAFMHQGA